MNPHPRQITRQRRPAGMPGTWLAALAMAVLLGLPPGGEGQAAPSVSELRDQMRELQTQRETREPLEDLIDLEPMTTSEDLETAHGLAAIELRSQMTTYNMVWIFEPVHATDQAGPVVAPMARNGSQWITLAPGHWRLSLVFGRPGSPQTWRLPPREIRVVRDRVYGIQMGEAAETALNKMETQAAREANFNARQRDEESLRRQPGKP